MNQKRHTDRQFEAELVELRQKLLTIGGLVEAAISDAVRSLVERETELARRVIDQDKRINVLELEADELCLRLLALRQPAASDLRFIAIALKVVTDLERMGDLAVNIAERAIQLNEEPQLKPWVDIPRMAELAQRMLKGALDALVEGDADRARKVLEQDGEVDELYHQIFRELLSYMIEEPKTTRRAMAILFVAKHLERLADHATNVAEMVIFFLEGRDIRHPRSRSAPASE